MKKLPLQIGQRVEYSKTVSESDVYLFAGITGDFSPNHVNEEVMRATPYGRRIAHGALLVGYMSTCSSMLCERIETPGETEVSLGYDRVRFLAPVFLGDTITVSYEVAEVDDDDRRTRSNVEVRVGERLCAVAVHILKWVPSEGPR